MVHSPEEVRVGTAAAVVNHNAGEALRECVESLRAEGIEQIVVVDNDSNDDSVELLERDDHDVSVVRSQDNLGYGAGANLAMSLVESETVLVSNPDVVVHRGAIASLCRALESDPVLAIVGPRICEADGSRYPSARRFPSLLDAAGHVLLGQFVAQNRFTRRYRMEDLDSEEPTEVDWVSGACFMARTGALEELGGFDESYFMYAEDVDLCWRARRAGWSVAYVPGAVVTHIRALSTSKTPYRMIFAHHRSAFRFAARRWRGWRRLLLPLVALLLALRLAGASAKQALGRPRHE